MRACEVCGKTKSGSRKFWTATSLRQHLRDAHDMPQKKDQLELTNTIADETWSDGAYFALAWELGEL